MIKTENLIERVLDRWYALESDEPCVSVEHDRLIGEQADAAPYLAKALKFVLEEWVSRDFRQDATADVDRIIEGKDP